MTRPKLLLADDSVTIRRVVELTFADEGVDVSTAGDAESAMQKFVEIQPDIVLVDIGLEGTNGYQICAMIKQDEATKHIPVLLLVGSFEPFDQDEAERAGADGFLTKPFHSIRDLVGRVSELLGLESEAETEVPNADFGSETTESAEENEAAMPNGEAEAVKYADAAVRPEVADIEELYQKSFSDRSFEETVEITDLDTMDDMLGDSGMDDEMIEASYAGGRDDDNVEAFVAAGEHTAEIAQAEGVNEHEVHEEPVETDDVTASELPDAHDEPREPEQATSSEQPDVDEQPDYADQLKEASAIKEFDWSPESMVLEGSPAEEITSAFEPKFVFEDAVEEESDKPFEHGDVSAFGQEQVTEEFLADPEPEWETPISQEVEAFQPPESEVEHSPTSNGVSSEPSAELINLIAQRVIERLSDKVIREVAQDAVPQIAERLIREALEDESKR
ncbi:MAG: response regulator [Acidobacteriota bacterium]